MAGRKRGRPRKQSKVVCISTRRKVAVKRTPKNNKFLELMEQFLKGLTQLYPGDKYSPGITLSFLEKERKFYASAKCYPGQSTSHDYKFLHCVKADTLLAAITELAGKFANNTNEAVALRQGKIF